MDDGFTGQRRPMPFPVTDPERIPVKRYYDEEFYKVECERLWPRVWQMAARLEQIPEVGDWVEYTNLGKSVIIIRTESGVKAFHNACRHRGVRLAKDHGNCKGRGFTCPFHGWRWNMDGKNTFVYGKQMFSERQVDPNDLALVPCRLELWGGCAWINFDNTAPSFRECIGPLADRLEHYQVDKVRAEWWVATVVPANWKTAIEAFLEGYHVMRTHPQLQASAPIMYNTRYGVGNPREMTPIDPKLSLRENIDAQIKHFELLSEGMGGMCHAKDLEVAKSLRDMPLPEGDLHQAMMMWFGTLNAEVTRLGRARGEATPDLNALAVTQPLGALEFLFPHYFLLPCLSSFSSYRIRPLGPESCLFELWSLTLFPEGKEPPAPKAPTILPYNSDQFPPIPRQDYSNIPEQQIGLHAEGFEFMRLGKDVEGLISNWNRVIDGYLSGAPWDRLSKASQQLGGGFDGPIINDLGL